MNISPLINLSPYRVAVLLAAFNGENWIAEQLNSIFSQEMVEVHVFVSLDASTDKTLDILKDYADREFPITILPYGARFGHAAKNFYNLIAKTLVDEFDYVAFSDQDDIWMPSKLSRGICMMRNSDALGYSSDVIAFWPNGKKRYIKKSYKQKKLDYLFEGAGPGCTYILEISSYIQFQRFVTQKLEELYGFESHDWLCYAFFRSRGFKWLIDNQPSLYYRQHSSNQFGANASLVAYFRRLKLMREGWYWDQCSRLATLTVGHDVLRKSLILKILQTRRRFVHSLILLVVMMFSRKKY